MSSLRSLAEQDVPEVTKTVEWTDPKTKKVHRAFLRGRPDATKTMRALMVQPQILKNKAAHYSKVTGSDFTEDMVRQILIIRQALVDRGETDEEQAVEPDDNAPVIRYDESVIANICAKYQTFFFMIVKESSELLGLTDLVESGTLLDDPTLKAAVGNSTEGEAPT